jgi:hypothetical protein
VLFAGEEEELREAVLLCLEHVEELAATADEGIELPGLLVGDGPHFRAHALGEECNNASINAVGLGELPGGLGVVPYLAGIDDYDRERGLSQKAYLEELQAAGCFEYDEFGVELGEAGDELSDTAFVVRHGEVLIAWAKVDCEVFFGYIDPDEDHFSLYWAGVWSRRGAVEQWSSGVARGPSL